MRERYTMSTLDEMCQRINDKAEASEKKVQTPTGPEVREPEHQPPETAAGDDKGGADAAGEGKEPEPARKEGEPKKGNREAMEFIIARKAAKAREAERKAKAITEELAKSDGLKYDPNTMSIDEYLALRDKRKELESIRDGLGSESHDSDFAELRRLQAEDVFESSEERKRDYLDKVAPLRDRIYGRLKELDPSGTFTRFLDTSRKAPLIEMELVSENGNQFLKDNLAINARTGKIDAQATWENLRAAERSLAEGLKEAAKKSPEAGKKPEQPPKGGEGVQKTPETQPSRATGSAVKGDGSTPKTAGGGMTLEQMRKFMRTGMR